MRLTEGVDLESKTDILMYCFWRVLNKSMAICKRGQEDNLCVIFLNDRQRQRLLSNAFVLFLVRLCCVLGPWRTTNVTWSGLQMCAAPLGSSGTLSHVSHSHSTTHILFRLPAIVPIHSSTIFTSMFIASASNEDVVCVNKQINNIALLYSLLTSIELRWPLLLPSVTLCWLRSPQLPSFDLCYPSLKERRHLLDT